MKWFKIIAWTILVLGVVSLGLFVAYFFVMAGLPFQVNIMKKIDWDEVWKQAKIHGSAGIEEKLALWILGIFMCLFYLTVVF